MKLKTRIQEVEAILITEVVGRLSISSKSEARTTKLTVDVGEYLIFDPVRGVQRMDHEEIKRLYTVDGEIDVPEASKEKKKRSRSKKIGLGNGGTGLRATYNSDEVATVAD